MPLKSNFNPATAAAVLLLGLSAAGCGQPDPQALKRLACEQAGASLDIQSLSQLDALRKALGLAPNVDPIGFCRSIGAKMDAAQSGAAESAGSRSEDEQ